MYIHMYVYIYMGFSGGSDDKESACSAYNLGSIPELGRSLGEGNGNLLQYSCLENSMYKRAWQATIHGVTKSDMTKGQTLTMYIYICTYIYISTKYPGMHVIAISHLYIFNFSKYSLLNTCLSIVY